MKIVHNAAAYQIAIEAATGTIEKEVAADGTVSFSKNKDKVKGWFTAKNKVGAKAVKRIAIAIEDSFVNKETGEFEMPNFTKVVVDEVAGHVELLTADGGLENTIILKP